jgi:hypothetical protein
MKRLVLFVILIATTGCSVQYTLDAMEQLSPKAECARTIGITDDEKDSIPVVWNKATVRVERSCR